MSQRDPFYLEARRVLLPAGSPPPLLRAASREALCWSKTSKNEASGPMGAKAMRADSNGKLQGQEAHRRPRRPCRVLQRTLPDSLSGDVGLFSQHFLTFYLGMRTLCPLPRMRITLSGVRRCNARTEFNQVLSHLRVQVMGSRGTGMTCLGYWIQFSLKWIYGGFICFLVCF